MSVAVTVDTAGCERRRECPGRPKLRCGSCAPCTTRRSRWCRRTNRRGRVRSVDTMRECRRCDGIAVRQPRPGDLRWPRLHPRLMRPIRSCSAPIRLVGLNRPASRGRPRPAGPASRGRARRRDRATSSMPSRDLVEVLIGRSDVVPDRGDKRFAHAAWEANPIYRRLVQAYLVETKALLDDRRRGGASIRRAASAPASR